MKHLWRAFVLLAIPLVALHAQVVRSYTFFGTDGLRSSHQVTIRISQVRSDAIMFEALGVANWFEPGQFRDCGSGCAWTTDYDRRRVFGGLDDAFHASNCSSGPPSTFCTGIDLWGPAGGVYTFDTEWIPTFVDVRIGYADLTSRTLRLELVPEPAVASLFAAGLAVLMAGGALRRKRSP